MQLDSSLITSKIEKKFLLSVDEVEKEIYQLVLKLLRKFDVKDGQFIPDDKSRLLLATLNKEIRKILDRVNIESDVLKFIEDFKLIDQNISAVQKGLNGIIVPKNIFTNQKQWAIDVTVNSLIESNINLKFVNPVKQLLYSRVSFGGSVVDAEKQLKQIMLPDKGNGFLKRWMGQIARDTINEYQGAINQQIKVQYGLEAVRYVGGLLEDSRPQCVRWVEDFNGYLTDEQLENEIKWAYSNGQGMKPDTTKENFCVKRGGYNCIHEAIPVRKK